MKRVLNFFVFLIAILAINTNLLAQTGPGGVGNATGTNGQPLNLIWLDGSVLSSFGASSVWPDKSGNGYDATNIHNSGNPPTIGTLNGFNTLNFDGSASYLQIPDDNSGANLLDGMPGMSILAVFNPGTTNAQCIISKRLNSTNRSWTLFHNTNTQLNGYVGGTAVQGPTDISGTFGFASYIVNNNLSLYYNGDFEASGGSGLTVPDRSENVTIGRFDESAGELRWFDGDIAEIVVFRNGINSTQRIIIENYFNAKYNLSFATAANDKMTGNDPSYIYDLAGIGQEIDGNHTIAASGNTGFYIQSTGSLDNGDYVMFAHNSSANSVSTADITGTVQERWAKDWYVEQTNTQNVKIIFDLPEGISGDYPQNISNYVLLYRAGTSGDYNIATTSSVGYADGDQVSFDILGANLSDGYYTLGTIDQVNSPVIGAPGTTWYTLVSGNWSDPDIWTLDPSGALPNNPTNSFPQNATDKVVIKTGKTVTMDLPGSTYTFASVTVNGRLDLQSKDHLYFNEIRGNGRIRMSSAVFPKYSNADHFIKAGQGEGTVVLYGNSFALDTVQEFYNLEVEMTAGHTVTLLEDYTLNGYLRVKSGTFKINDDTPIGDANNINLTVKGDVDILSGAFISTGTGNARHQFNLYGDLTNNGELRFTNRVAANYTAEATNGIVDANFLNDSKNQAISCNGISNFYRIEIDKGTDKTYILSIEASAAANFNLFGYANEGHADIAQLAANNNALGLLRGTVKIGNNVNIPVLNNSGNYNISEAAQIWVNGGTVIKPNGTAIVPYGIARVSAGTFTASVGSGFTLRDNGLIKVEGGSLNATQIRTSVLGAGNVGGYVQSGGTATIDGSLGGSPNTDYYIFSLTYPGNVFAMTGGTLVVKGVQNIVDHTGGTSGQWHGGAIFINSDPENINVTGGTVIMDISTNTDAITNYRITSKAPFFNVIMRKSNAGSDDTFLLTEGTSGDNAVGDFYTVTGQPLIVLNDFKLEGEETSPGYPNIDFYAVTDASNVNDVYIGGSFIIEAGAQYWTAADGDRTRNYNTVATQPTIVNTTYFNQTIGTSSIDTLYWGNVGDQFDYDSNSTTDADENMAEFGNFVLDRTSGNEFRLVSPGPGSGLRGNSSLTVDVNGDASVLSGTFDQGRLTFRIWGAITNYDRFGTWYENGSYPIAGGTPNTAQIRFREDPPVVITTSDNAIFGNIRFNINTATNVELNSDLYIERLDFMRGAIYIKNHHLKIDNMWNLRDANNYFVGTNSSDTINVADVGITGNRLIFTDGKSSDKGLSIKITQNTPSSVTPTTIDQNTAPVAFPIGFTPDGGVTKYNRPAQLKVKNFVDSGYVNIHVVSDELQTTELTGGEILQHYWKVSSTDFTTLPTVAFRFYYRNQIGVSNVDLPTGTSQELNYVPGKVLDGLPYTRSFESDPVLDITDVDESLDLDANTRWIVFNGTSTNAEFDQNNFVGFTLEKANYTAGLSTRFVGAPQIFYSRNTSEQAWTNGNAWSLSRDGGAAGDYPRTGDVAVLTRDNGGAGDPSAYGAGTFRIDNSTGPITVAAVLFDDEDPVNNNWISGCPRITFDAGGGFAAYNSNLGEVSVSDNHIGGPSPNNSHGAVIQYNVNPTYTGIFPNGDFGNFNNYENALVIYSWDGGNGTVTLSQNATSYPMLWFAGGNSNTIIQFPNTDVIVNGRANVNGDIRLRTTAGISRTLTFKNNVEIGSGCCQTGYFQFPGNATENQTVIIEGNLTFNVTNPGTIQLVNNTGTNLHKLIIKGNVDIPTGGTMNLGDGINSNVLLEIQGESDNTFDNTGSAILYRIIMNKGNSQTNSFTFNNNFTLTGPTSGAGVLKALELQNGTLIFNNSAINVNLTTGNDNFEIPATTCLEVRQGQVNANGGSGILLQGKLLVSGGTVDMTGGNNYIQYSASGNATIEVTDGTLSVGSQVRRGLTSDQGILIFNQSGGNVNLGISAAPEANRGIFEIMNAGSSFTQTGGNFTIVNDYRTNPSTQSFYFDPETVNLSSGTNITFGNAQTQSGRGNFTMYAADSIMNLVIDNTSGFNPNVTLQVVPLSLKENLNIQAGTELVANGLDINILGDFNNSGTFTANGNTSYFVGTSDQQINGATTFFNLTKNTSNKLSLAASSEITIDNVLSLEDGTFDDNDNNVNVKGNLFSDIVTSSPGTNDGIIMNGTSVQEITGSGTYAKLTINNVNGILVPTSNNITISEKLKLQSGVFDIGRNLLVLNENAIIEEASPFSESNMIQTNISFTDAGVKKYFPAISTPTQFIYPMGSVGKYTPIQFDITACDAGGSIRVRAADEMHISITEDFEAPNPEIVDADNVLQYNWTLDADGITGFSATATMESYSEDVKVTTPYTVADYITARLLDAGLGAWTKYDVADFNEATNELYFYFAGTNDLGIDGDYTAGIDDAIPDMVPSYITIQDGPWNVASTWDTYPIAGGSVPAGGPRGAIVYVVDSVSMPANFMAAYITNIESSGIVNVGTTFGHRLGIVNGTGKLFLQRGDLPAGVYDGFFAADSGTIQFNGSTDYDILSEITYVNNIILTGTGKRRFPNLDLTIYGDLTIGDGVDFPNVINEHYQMISVYKDVHFNSGTFDAGFGDNAIFSLAGNTHQIIYGNFTGMSAFNHFQINNPAGATLSSSDIEIDNKLILSSGVLYSSSTNTITLHSILDDIVTGGGNSTHISGPLFKRINNGGSFYFPVGNSGRFGRVLVTNRNAIAGYWQVQYYNQNPNSAGYNPTIFTSPLTQVSTGEYWRIQGPTGTDLAEVGLRWDNQSGMPTSDITSRNQLKIAEWRDIDNDSPGTTTDDIWQDIGPTYTISGTSSSGTIASDVDINFDEFSAKGNIFTVSSVYVALDPTWDGSVSSVWNDPDNWTPAAVPTAGDDIIIPSGMPNDPVISINAVCSAMDLQSGATLTINPTASLTLSGNLTMNGDLSILSSTLGTGSLLDNGTITGSGTASVQRYISGNKIYHYISPALSAVPQTTFSIAPWGAVNPNFYIYDETNNNPDWNYGWISGSTITPNMDIARGYAFAFTYNNTFTMTGGNFNTGAINQGVTNSNYSVASDGWNLIGNPYPSAVSADEFIFANTGVIDGTLYFWDDDGSGGTGYESSDYATWNLAGAVGTGNGASSTTGSVVPDGSISNGQGFFVHASASGNVNFTNNMRRIGNGQFFKSNEQDNTIRLRLSLTNDAQKLYNEALLTFIQGASDGFDNLYDGKKLAGNAKIAFYSLLNNEEYAIQSYKPLSNKTNNVKEILMGYKVTVSGDYSFNAVQFENIAADLDVYLQDKLTDVTINLKEVSNYVFTTNAGTFNDRFVIRFNYSNENTNSAPILRREIANYSATEDQNFSAELDKNTFGDVDANDKLTYTAKLQGGSFLPGWLSFNPETLTFTGLPANSDVGNLSVEITATDNSGETATDIFTIEVVNVNDAPELINEIPDQEIDQNALYEYSIPVNTFTDIDLDDELSIAVKMADGSELPTWLSFDQVTGKLAGTAEIAGDFLLAVSATDIAGASVSDQFILRVKSTTGLGETAGDKIKIYPNPTKGQLVIETQKFVSNTRFIVRDYYGKTIAVKLAEGKTTNIDLSAYADGIYFIEMTDGVESKVYRVILNR